LNEQAIAITTMLSQLLASKGPSSMITITINSSFDENHLSTILSTIQQNNLPIYCKPSAEVQKNNQNLCKLIDDYNSRVQLPNQPAAVAPQQHKLR
jgi:hypothetical protein